jgi:hypothetical protein
LSKNKSPAHAPESSKPTTLEAGGSLETGFDALNQSSVHARAAIHRQQHMHITGVKIWFTESFSLPAVLLQPI